MHLSEHAVRPDIAAALPKEFGIAATAAGEWLGSGLGLRRPVRVTMQTIVFDTPNAFLGVSHHRPPHHFPSLPSGYTITPLPMGTRLR